MTNSFRFLPALGAAVVAVTLQPRGLGALQISEFMADNADGLQDEDADYSDWIEIYNSKSPSVPASLPYLRQ